MIKAAFHQVTRAIRIGFRAAKILATSRDLPRLLRILFVIGCVQIPVLPFDEIALAIALAWLAIFHRSTLRAAITAAANKEDKS
jgi:hypothetical protein